MLGVRIAVKENVETFFVVCTLSIRTISEYVLKRKKNSVFLHGIVKETKSQKKKIPLNPSFNTRVLHPRIF